MSIKDPGIKGRIWISKVTMPIPSEEDIRLALFKAIEGLKEPGEAPGGYKEPELLPCGGGMDWVQSRRNEAECPPEAARGTTVHRVDERSHISGHDIVFPWWSALSYGSCEPQTYDERSWRNLQKARVFSVRYRLAPKNPFPAAVLDALVSYFNLLYPPAGSFHEPVDPKHIVLGGDSAGGNLCLALLQTLLEIRRQGLKNPLEWRRARGPNASRRGTLFTMGRHYALLSLLHQ